MVLVSEFCAQLLSCQTKSLRDRLNHPGDRVLALNSVTGRKVRTTYKDRNGMSKTFFVGGITTKGAAFTPHMEDCVGRTIIHLPYVPCIIERFPSGGEDRFYPMELLELVEDEASSNWIGRMFKEIDTTQQRASSSSTTDSALRFRIDEEDEENTGRDECSQPTYTCW
uniref:Uncharacterized protein n=1 Tax=Globodera rostochiensis TaxID=31243 RepID=A0A914GUJ4_GLORO